MKSVNSEAGSSLHIFGEIIDKHGFVGHGRGFAQRAVKNYRRGFAVSHAAGVNARGKVAHEGIVGLEMGHVNGIGIGEQMPRLHFSERRSKSKSGKIVAGSRTLFQIAQNSSNV